MNRYYVGALWLASGVPVGLLLILLPPECRLWCFAAFVMLENGHTLSPIVLAWTHTSFRRQFVLARPVQFILLPSLIFGVAMAVGAATHLGWTSFPMHQPGAMWRITDLSNPLPIMVWVYWAWNIYHFGMQHFGVLRMSFPRSNRRVGMFACLGLTIVGMGVLPAFNHSQDLGFMILALMSVNHWIVDIGLSSRVSRHWWALAGGVLVAGMVGFMWVVPTSHGLMIRIIPAIIGARLGLGFVHFLYSRWVWRLSDPQISAALGLKTWASAA